MSRDPLSDFSGDPLTRLEYRKLRKIIQDQERMEWLWATARIWIGYSAAVVATIFATKEYIVKLFKAMFT